MNGWSGLRPSLFACTLLLAWAFPVNLPAQTEPQPAAPAAAADILAAELHQPLPASPDVLIGELDNGLRYFIRENSEPENRAILRFVVDAGSVLEDNDQLGLAHLLEHMAFNGTENFEKQELVAFMESIGMRLGPGLNATTSFDETIYMLSVPTEESEYLETAFDIMRDWASALTLDPEEMERERLVVIEEWRGGLGAGSRVRDQHLPVLLQGSRYAERLPIGTLESLETFEHDAVRRFYEDWYRPEMMAVIAVGDFDAEAVEDLVRTAFETRPALEQGPERHLFEVPPHEETLFSIVTDPEMPATTVEVYHKMAPDDDYTVGGFRRRIVEHLYNYLLNERLQELARQADPPFRAAASMNGSLVRTADAYMLRAQVADDGIERGLQTLVLESERVARHGFTEAELERGRRGVLREMERQYTNRDNRNSAALAAQYIRAYLNDAPVPGIEYEYALYQRFLPQITLEDVNSVGRAWVLGNSRVVLITAPEREDLELPDEQTLSAILDGADGIEIEAYTEAVTDGTLLETPPAGGEILAERRLDGDLTEWELDNGVRVVLKPTDFGGDEVQFMAFGPGGLALASDDEFAAVRSAAGVVEAGGVGALDATALRRALTGHVVNVSPYIGMFEQGVVGNASATDLETMFQLVYLRFTAPRADESAFQALITGQRVALANRDRNPATAFNDTFQRLLTNDHPRQRPLTLEALEEIDLERSLAFYRERFGDAGGFTFIFAGAFEHDTIRPLVEQYLGGLPGETGTAVTADPGFTLHEGVSEETVQRGLEPRSQTRIAFRPPTDFDSPSEQLIVGATAQLMQTQLRNVLRQELGGTYSVAVMPISYRQPEELLVPVIEFTSAPERNPELVEAIFAEIAALREDGPAAALVADTRAALLRDHETRLRQNRFWVSALASSYRDDEEPGAGRILTYADRVEALTADSFREAVRRYFDPEQYLRVTLMPED